MTFVVRPDKESRESKRLAYAFTLLHKNIGSRNMSVRLYSWEWKERWLCK